MIYKIIVAVSSPSVQKAIQMAFPESEFEIYPFADGIEVMKSSSQIVADAVLLSLSLPPNDGYEVGFHLKRQEKFKQIPLILLKGAFEPLDRKKIADLDFDEIVEEPLDSEGLVHRVRNLIEGSKQIQTLPEEPALEEIPAPESEPNPPEKEPQIGIEPQDSVPSSEKTLSAFPSEWEAKIKEIVRDLMREEILDVERELEKRIKAQVSIEQKGEK